MPIARDPDSWDTVVEKDGSHQCAHVHRQPLCAAGPTGAGQQDGASQQGCGANQLGPQSTAESAWEGDILVAAGRGLDRSSLSQAHNQ